MMGRYVRIARDHEIYTFEISDGIPELTLSITNATASGVRKLDPLILDDRELDELSDLLSWEKNQRDIEDDEVTS